MKRRQSRLISEQKFINAVSKIIAEEGMSELGVNAVARRAGMDKVLLYRYFGGLSGLLKRFSETAEFWPSCTELLHAVPQKITPSNLRSAVKKIYFNFYQGFRNRPITLDILAFECIGRNELTESLEEVREVRGKEIFEELAKRGFPITDDNAVCASIFSAATQYLAVRARDIRIFGPLRLDSTEGWSTMAEKMAAAIEKLTVWE